MGVVLLAALNFFRQLPEIHSVEAIVLGDPGLGLAVDRLLDDGLIPTRDFAYFYGLLGIDINRLWFAVVGKTAIADTTFLAIANLAIALGLARFARPLELPLPACILLLAGVPFAVMPLRFTSPTHALDAAILVHALAFQLRGNDRTAFALAVVGVFVKSALISVYATGLLGLILFSRDSESIAKSRIRQLGPGAIIGIGIALALIGQFGWRPLLKTLFPLAGAQAYSGESFGFFFGIGRLFWWRPPFDPVYYFLGPAGFWLSATAVMLAGIPGLLRDCRDRQARTLLTVAALHLFFVFFLFGNDLSWLYYSFLPLLGACGVVGRWQRAGSCPGWLLLSLPIIAMGNWVGFSVYGLQLWNERSHSPSTAGLFASPAEQLAWEHIRSIAREKRVLILTPSGAGRVVFPEVDSIRSSALLPAIAPTIEIDRLLEGIDHAEIIVLHEPTSQLFQNWPIVSTKLKQFAVEQEPMKDSKLTILRRSIR